VNDSAINIACKPRLLASSNVRGCYTKFTMSGTYFGHLFNLHGLGRVLNFNYVSLKTVVFADSGGT
jgi:hypothetical protein